jgi:hypothetical protein
LERADKKTLNSKKMKNKMITVGGIHNSANIRNNDRKITPISCCNIEIALKQFPEWSDRRIAEEHGVGRYLENIRPHRSFRVERLT